MRISVVSVNGKPLMPTTPCRARKMVRSGVAKKCWNKLGVFYIQMLRPVGEVVQDMALAIDPGSKYDGYAVTSEKETQLCGMAVLPNKVKEKNKNRREMRRGRRYRNTRRRKSRFSNRRRKEGWIAPSQLAKVRLRLKIASELWKIFPIKHIVVEDVRFNHYQKKWGKFFSTVEIGKTMLYSELEAQGKLFLLEGWQTKKARENYGILKCLQKDKLIRESHANDAVAMCCEFTNDEASYGDLPKQCKFCLSLLRVSTPTTKRLMGKDSSLSGVPCIVRTSKKGVFAHTLEEQRMALSLEKEIMSKQVKERKRFVVGCLACLPRKPKLLLFAMPKERG